VSHDREKLSRSYEFRMEPTGDDGLTLEGYAAVFNDWTTINDRSGSFQEQVAPGAFKRSLGMRSPVIQFDHGQHPLIGSMPLGRITKIEEDTRGLFVRAKMHDNWLIEPVRDAIREQSIDGMSFRFSVIDEDYEVRDGVEYRTITEAALYEVGPVVFPAYPSTSVSVRSRQVAEALIDEDVRRELAVLFQMDTDQLRDVAGSPVPDPDPSDEDTREVTETPAEGHVSVRSKAQRQAIARLTLDT
jgi:HK97 family phage prohead protease